MKEYKIIEAPTQKILTPKGDRKYIPMFKLSDKWFFAIEIKSYSLMTIKECKEFISEMSELPNMAQEWQLAEFGKGGIPAPISRESDYPEFDASNQF